MSQMTFQNIRNLGANGNQPLITNQNDYAIFDNVTWIKGKHTVKSGGSITLRSREILNPDTITGVFNFNNNMTSNCAGQPAGCTVNAPAGFDVASLMLGLVNTKSQEPTSTKTPIRRSGPGTCSIAQDDFRATNRLTIKLGIEACLAYPPWIEVNNGQSNFDETTGKFVVASDDAVIHGVKVGRYLQTYWKWDPGLRFGFAYDLNGSGSLRCARRIGVFCKFTPGWAASSSYSTAPAVPAGDSAQRRPRPPTASTCCSRTVYRGLRDFDPARPVGWFDTVVSSDINFRDVYARQWNLNVQRSLATNYMVEIAYVGSQGRQMLIKGDPNEAKPVVGVTDSNVNLGLSSALCAGPSGMIPRTSPEQGHARLQRAAGEASSVASPTTSRP